ncbi:MAG TPA: carbonic anhydrase [Bryobacteraceae bacterium]|nr:carbonic anhydrase [Bryobacteraceae bacterium]
MRLLKELFENNRAWAEGVEQRSPGFFAHLAQQQVPEYFWIGCADSRVPANEIVGLMPGEIFVHRNIANVVNPFDPNCLACLEYAVGVLSVKHVMVVGHYGCGGVRAVIEGHYRGKVGEWLAPLRAVNQKYAARLGADEQRQWDTLCELNVIEQAAAVWESVIVREAWAHGQELAVHGWIYAVADGLLRDLEVTVASSAEADGVRRAAVERVLAKSARV